MPTLQTIPVTTSIAIDTAHNLETRADLANKTAEVVNLVDGENWTDGGGGGDSDFSTAEVTIINNTDTALMEKYRLVLKRTN